MSRHVGDLGKHRNLPELPPSTEYVNLRTAGFIQVVVGAMIIALLVVTGVVLRPSHVMWWLLPMGIGQIVSGWAQFTRASLRARGLPAVRLWKLHRLLPVATPREHMLIRRLLVLLPAAIVLSFASLVLAILYAVQTV